MHVVVLGAGYAGISLVAKLERRLSSEVTLTLVDQHDYHLVQHLLHRVVREPSLADRISIPLEDLLDRAHYRQGVVTDVNPNTGGVELEDGTLEYDVGALCLGAQTAFYGLPGIAEHATPLKGIDHAEQIRDEFDRVCRVDGRVVVGGAGLSGIQIAGELAAIADECEGMPDVLLLEQANSVVPTFSDQFQSAVRNELEVRNVDVWTGSSVERVTKEMIEMTDDTTLAYDQLIWTGGITGQDAMGRTQPQVRADLRLGDRTVALGDAARVIDTDGEAVPASAKTAVSQADVAATNVSRLVDHNRDTDAFEPRLDRYRYKTRGWVVTVGDGTVAQVGPAVFSGPKAKALKTTIGADYLHNIGAPEYVPGIV